MELVKHPLDEVPTNELNERIVTNLGRLGSNILFGYEYLEVEHQTNDMLFIVSEREQNETL